MKLLKCYISSFGKLEDFSYDFCDGLNEIKEENGWGKSTFSYFIKTMFYGLSGDRKTKVKDNERERFRPWNGKSKFGGYIEFSRNGKEYRIERYFGKKESEDTVLLIDKSTGKSYSGVTDWGRRIFDIDSDGFFSTVYFSQSDFEAAGNSSITEKYNSVCGENTMADAFDSAIKNLEKEKKDLLNSGGKRGRIADVKYAIQDCSERINQLKSQEGVCDELRLKKARTADEIVRIKSQTEELNKKLNEINRAEAVKIKRNNLKEYFEEKNEVCRQLKSETEIFNGNNIDREEIAAGKECIKNLHETDEKLLEIEKKHREISEKFGENSSKEKNNYVDAKKPTNVYLSFVCVVLAVITVVLGVLSKSIGLVPVLVGAAITVAATAFTIWLLRRKKRRIDIREKELDKNSEKFYKESESLRKEYSDTYEIKEKYENTLKEFLSRYKVDINDFSGSFYKLEYALDGSEKLKKRIEAINLKISALESDDDLKKEAPETESAFSVEGRLKELNVRLEELLKEEKGYSERIARIESDTANIPDLENKIDEYEELFETYKERYDVLSKTYEYMLKADENLKVKYRKPLEESFNKYLRLISEKNITAEIDVDLNVFVLENGERKETDYYSKGYRELFEICKRFALIDVLFKSEKPFIILDDPLYNLDEAKLSQSTALIKKLSEEYQIIYLICHESRRI